MSAVGVRELKNRLTHYLQRVRQGEEVVVTERGKPVALLVSLRDAGPAKSREARLARLAAAGVISLPRGKPLRRIRRVRVSGEPVSRTILEDRR
jgi:prevent-host-death family protein